MSTLKNPIISLPGHLISQAVKKSNVQVKPAELFQAALDKQKQFAAGEANMAMPIAVLADASTRLFELETYNLVRQFKHNPGREAPEASKT
ncbi:MAG: hypothetical protein R3D26_14865 [Cyanobacteriota/Melainabacteria group bacterium]